MSTTVKILLVLAACFLLSIVVIVGGAAYWWSQHSQEYLDAGKRSFEEGAAFGRTTDNQGCVSEAISRHKANPGFKDAIANNIFLRSCLNKSRPTSGFCEAIPKRTEFIKSAQWQKQQCSDAGLSDSYCPQLFSQVQQYCEEGATKTEGKN